MKTSVAMCLLLLSALLLGGCSKDGGGDKDTVISGIVLLPAQQVAANPRPDMLARLRGLFISDLRADVIGLAPVANTTVELVRLDSQGNVSAVLASTTSDASGNYSFTTTEPPSSDLAVRLPGQPGTTRAIVTQTNTDITPVTEAVVRSIVDEITASAGSVVLGNYTVEEVAALVDLVNGMDIDVSTAPTFEDAVLTVRSQAGSILTDMTAGYGSPASVAALYQNNYALTGETTTLVPPPQLNGTSAGIDHRAIDGGMGFERNTQRIKSGTEFSLLLLNDLTSASYFCDSDQLHGDRFVPAANGQVTVTPAGGSAVVGALSADNSLLIYPWTHTRAGIDGNSSGLGRGLRIGFIAQNLPPTQGTNRNPQVSGNYNMVWTANYVSNGGGMMGGGSTFSSATGSITLIFDATQTNGNLQNPQSPLSSANGTVTTLTVDLGNYAVTSTSGTDTLSGVYQVLPGTDVLIPLGDTAAMMGGMGGNSGDFLQGMRLQVADGQVSPLLAFSSWIAGGGMGGGGGMGMGNAQCGSTGGGMMGSGGGMMGGAAGEGRGVALAARQESGIDQTRLSGVYNAVALITTFTEGTGTAFVDSEVNYGTFTLDGAGNISAGTLYFQRATMDVAAAAGGNNSAVSSSTGNNSSYTGTYSVSATDGTLTMAINGLGTGSGFAARGGELLVLPIQETAATTGRRGILILLRQP
ncbi:MAG TPA: hypothetical protein ENK48_08160 [Gammaproteobacteria bacterium]|nr:hypothetical protein [Gammaproteobacteria bacterium]